MRLRQGTRAQRQMSAFSRGVSTRAYMQRTKGWLRTDGPIWCIGIPFACQLKAVPGLADNIAWEALYRTSACLACRLAT